MYVHVCVYIYIYININLSLLCLSPTGASALRRGLGSCAPRCRLVVERPVPNRNTAETRWLCHRAPQCAKSERRGVVQGQGLAANT